MLSKDISKNNDISQIPKEEIPDLRINPFITTEKLPQIILEKDIFNIMQTKMNITEEIKDIIKINYNLKDTYIENVKKALNERIYKKKSIKIEGKEKDKALIGRKKNNDASVRAHNKFSSDNIINKIKNIIKKYLIFFVNNVINSLYDGKMRKNLLNKLNIPNNGAYTLIKDIDYQSIAKKKTKKDNLYMLKLTINQFLSQKISTRYRSFKEEYEELSQNNKLIIDVLLEDKKNRAIFNFIFNKLNVGNFLDIFIYQKELNDFYDFNLLEEGEKNIIKNGLIRVDLLFNEIKDEANYLFCFILLIYNYKRYYLIKQSRSSSKKNIITKDETSI